MGLNFLWIWGNSEISVRKKYVWQFVVPQYQILKGEEIYMGFEGTEKVDEILIYAELL